MAHWYLIQEIW